MKRTMKRTIEIITLIAVSGVMFVTSCATTATGSRPDDMSYDEHLAAAELEKEKAKVQADKYDPKAVYTTPDWRQGGIGQYNPTGKYLVEAKQHLEHAKQHEAAATQLKAFEEQECGLFPPQTRSKCPLIGTVESVEPIDGGVAIHLKEGVSLDAVEAHSRCHVAFGNKYGRKGMSGCPLYLKDITVSKSPDGKVLRITSSDADVVESIRKRAEAHVGLEDETCHAQENHDEQ
ncbi:MAG: hypothetical protein GXP54_01845 [Deltaproteobacteria bacterium]|nr:hypothetical protein [Deltaproteobacteria bacterium]